MKSKIVMVLSIVVFVFGLNQNGFSQKKAMEEIRIKTSAVCNECKKTLESNLIYERGVKDVHLDLDSKELTLHYNPVKTNPELLRKAVSELGYDADTIPADPKAYAKLKSCCKKDGGMH